MDEKTQEQVRRPPRQADRQRAISEAVMAEGAVRIEQLAERFGISLMTVHRDLDELESRGLLRKSRGVATAQASSLVESSDVYRAGQQLDAKRALAATALEHIETGQSVFLDDSTTVLQLAKLLPQKAPLTIITNVLTVMNELHGVRGISLVSLGGNYYNWCSAFMGRMTNDAITKLRADVFVMSTAAITDDTCFFQTPETVDTKRAMFDSAAVRILLTDHTKFDKRALHALAPLRDFDVVIVDAGTDSATIARLRSQGIHVEVARAAR
jgi:DeoR/GlpR family transcriptional regulator of sugar metabolism